MPTETSISSTWHRVLALLGLLAVLLAGTNLASPTIATASPVTSYTVRTDVSARPTPTAAPTGVYGIPSGATFGVECQVIGQPVGPNLNTLYFWSDYAGRTFYIPDTYTSSPHLAGQPAIAGIPMCGSSQSSPVPSSAPTVTTAAWVGSPVSGTWPSSADSSPSNHHTPYGGDWSVDLQNVGVGQPVVLYAAPQKTSAPVSAVVESVGPACSSGNPADGGYQVRVALYNGATKIGWVTFAHIQPLVSRGQSVGRWGTTVGTVGSYNYRNTGCWDGVHVHTEMYNQHAYSCYNGTYRLGSPLSRTNFIGFVGGAYANGSKQPCP